MAVVSSTLDTILRLSGLNQYVHGLQQVAQAHQLVAQAARQQAAAQAATAAAQSRALGGGATLMLPVPGAGGGGIAPAQLAAAAALALAIRAIAGAVKETIDAFDDYDRAVLRTQLFLKNFGQNLPTGEVQNFARQLSLSFGASQTEIVQTMAYLARFATSGRSLEAATRVIVQASNATGVSMQELAQGIEMARRGNARQLFRELGIPVRGLAGQLYSLDQIIQIVDMHTRGGAGIFGGTLPGAIKKSQAALEDLKIQFGALISPLVITWLNQVAFVITKIADFILGLNKSLGLMPQSMRTAAQAASGAGAPDKSEEYLRRIAFNTGPQGALGHAIRGGGSFGEAGGGLRIRDFNSQFRHVR